MGNITTVTTNLSKIPYSKYCKIMSSAYYALLSSYIDYLKYNYKQTPGIENLTPTNTISEAVKSVINRLTLSHVLTREEGEALYTRLYREKIIPNLNLKWKQEAEETLQEELDQLPEEQMDDIVINTEEDTSAILQYATHLIIDELPLMFRNIFL